LRGVQRTCRLLRLLTAHDIRAAIVMARRRVGFSSDKRCHVVRSFVVIGTLLTRVPAPFQKIFCIDVTCAGGSLVISPEPTRKEKEP